MILITHPYYLHRISFVHGLLHNGIRFEKARNWFIYKFTLSYFNRTYKKCSEYCVDFEKVNRSLYFLCSLCSTNIVFEFSQSRNFPLCFVNYKNTGLCVCVCFTGARRHGTSLESGNGLRRALSVYRWRCVSCTCAMFAIVYALILLGLLLYIAIKYGPTVVETVQTANQHKGTHTHTSTYSAPTSLRYNSFESRVKMLFSKPNFDFKHVSRVTPNSTVQVL